MKTLKQRIIGALLLQNNAPLTPEYLNNNYYPSKSLKYIKKLLRDLVRTGVCHEAFQTSKNYAYSLGFYIHIVNPNCLTKHNLSAGQKFFLLEELENYNITEYTLLETDKFGISKVSYELTYTTGNTRIGENCTVILSSNV